MPNSKPHSIGLAAEFVAIFLATPLILYVHATRWNVHVGLWIVTLYAIWRLRRNDHISWREIWHGNGWPRAQRKIALLRFGAATALILIFTYALAPERMLGFPLQRPWFWLLVMALYPILSALPQELVFRSFFFRRYAALFSGPRALMAANAFCFGFIHIVFHNPVSPLLSAIGGLIFASSYRRHRSLKWAAVEHAAYGCMVFTAGIGAYFLVGGLR